MNKSRYKKLFNDQSVVKCCKTLGMYFKLKNERAVFSFSFSHNGSVTSEQLLPLERISLNICSNESFVDALMLPVVDSDILILANSDVVDYSLSYSLSIDEKKRVLRVVVEDYPLLAESFITEQEKSGLSLSF